MEALAKRHDEAARLLIDAGAAVDAVLAGGVIVDPTSVLSCALGALDDLYFDRSSPRRPTNALVLELLRGGAADGLSASELENALALAHRWRLRRVAGILERRRSARNARSQELGG